jgi:hypothetical protein
MVTVSTKTWCCHVHSNHHPDLQQGDPSAVLRAWEGPGQRRLLRLNKPADCSELGSTMICFDGGVRFDGYMAQVRMQEFQACLGGWSPDACYQG